MVAPKQTWFGIAGVVAVGGIVVSVLVLGVGAWTFWSVARGVIDGPTAQIFTTAPAASVKQRVVAGVDLNRVYDGSNDSRPVDYPIYLVASRPAFVSPPTGAAVDELTVFLLEHGADPNLRSKENKRLVIDWIVDAPSSELVDAFLDASGDVCLSEDAVRHIRADGLPGVRPALAHRLEAAAARC